MTAKVEAPQAFDADADARVSEHLAVQKLFSWLRLMCGDWGWNPSTGDAVVALDLLRLRGWEEVIPVVVGFARDQGKHGKDLSALREYWGPYAARGIEWLKERRVGKVQSGKPPVGYVEVLLEELDWNYFPGRLFVPRTLEDYGTWVHGIKGACICLDRLPEPKGPCFDEETQWISGWDDAIAFIEHTHELPRKMNRTTLERRLKQNRIPYEASDGGSKKIHIRRFDLERLRLSGLCRCDRCVPADGEGLAAKDDDSE